MQNDYLYKVPTVYCSSKALELRSVGHGFNSNRDKAA